MSLTMSALILAELTIRSCQRFRSFQYYSRSSGQAAFATMYMNNSFLRGSLFPTRESKIKRQEERLKRQEAKERTRQGLPELNEDDDETKEQAGQDEKIKKVEEPPPPGCCGFFKRAGRTALGE